MHRMRPAAAHTAFVGAHQPMALIGSSRRLVGASCVGKGADAAAPPSTPSKPSKAPKPTASKQRANVKTTPPSPAKGWWKQGGRAFNTKAIIQDPWAGLLRKQPSKPTSLEQPEDTAQASGGSNIKSSQQGLYQHAASSRSASSQQEPQPDSEPSFDGIRTDLEEVPDTPEAPGAPRFQSMRDKRDTRGPLQRMPDIQSTTAASPPATAGLPRTIPAQQAACSQLDELCTCLHTLNLLLAYQDADTHESAARDGTQVTTASARASWFAVPYDAVTGASTAALSMDTFPHTSRRDRLQHLNTHRDIAASMELLGAEEARQGAAWNSLGRLQLPKSSKGAQLTVAEVVGQLQQSHPHLFPEHDSAGVPVRAAQVRGTPARGEVQETAASTMNEVTSTAVRADVHQVLEKHGLAADGQLLEGVLEMIDILGVPPTMPSAPHALNSSTDTAASPSIPSHKLACQYLDSWLTDARQLEEAEPGLRLCAALHDHHHLLLRSTQQVQDSIAALKLLLGPSVGPQAVQLINKQPHLLYKAGGQGPHDARAELVRLHMANLLLKDSQGLQKSQSSSQLEADLEDLLDITHITPARLVTAIEYEPSILAHHHAQQLASTWSHLSACVTSSQSWWSQLPELTGQDLATALGISFSELDGLHYLIDRQQDSELSLAQALQAVSKDGLGRKYRRWKQRHLLRAEWHLMTTDNGPTQAHDTSSTSAVTSLSRAVVQQVIQDRAQEAARLRNKALQVQQQEQVLRASLALVTEAMRATSSTT